MGYRNKVHLEVLMNVFFLPEKSQEMPHNLKSFFSIHTESPKSKTKAHNVLGVVCLFLNLKTIDVHQNKESKEI